MVKRNKANKGLQLKMGVRVEMEHKKTVGFIKQYFKQHKHFPSNKVIFRSIAKDHLKEDPRYYTKLKKYNL